MIQILFKLLERSLILSILHAVHSYIHTRTQLTPRSHAHSALHVHAAHSKFKGTVQKKTKVCQK
jgi:hypothetical protein